MRACVCVSHGGPPHYTVLVCVITALSSEPKLSIVRLGSAQVSSTAQGQTPDSVSAGPDTGGNSTAVLKTSAPSGYVQV